MGGYPSFPSPFPTDNPYIGAASGFANAAPLVASLREAANQHAQLLQKEKEKQTADYGAGLQRDFENQRQLANEGFVASQTYPDLPGGQPAPGRPTLMTPEDNPAAAGGGPTVTDPNGREYIKTQKEKPQDDTNSFVLSPTVAQAMNEFGIENVKPGDRFPLAHAGLATEAMKAHLGKSQLDDTNSVTITQGMADKLAPHGISLKPGARVSLEKAADLRALVEIGEPKADKPARTRVDLEHFNTPISVNEDTGDISPLKLPPGVKPQATPGQQEANQRSQERQQDRQDKNDQHREDQQQKGRDLDQKTLDALQTKEQEQHAKRQAYGSVLAAKDGDQIVDPDNREQYPMGPVRRKFYQDRFDKATSLAGTYADQQKKLIARDGGGDQPAADAPKSAPSAAAKPAKNQQQTGKKPPVTMQHVRNYATQKGVSEAQAIREFQQYGYSIGQ